MKLQPSIHERLQAGDETVLAFLLQSEQLGLYRFLRFKGLVRNIQESNQFLHDALIDIWHERSAYTNPGDVYRNLRIYVRNKAVDAFRKATAKKQLRITGLPREDIAEIGPEVPGGRDREHYKKKMELFYQELRLLEGRAAEVIQRHYFDNMSFQAIADELGISASTVRTTHERAMAQLRTRLSPAISPDMLDMLFKVTLTMALLSLLPAQKKSAHFVDAFPVLTTIPVPSQNLIYGNRP